MGKCWSGNGRMEPCAVGKRFGTQITEMRPVQEELSKMGVAKDNG